MSNNTYTYFPIEGVQMERITPETLAERLYETYCQAVGGKAFNGAALPGWAEFRADPGKLKQSDGWVKVAEDVLSAGYFD